MDPFVQAAHATDNSHKVLTYFTTRELSNHAHELFAFHALDGEIIKQEPHPGKPGAQWLQEVSPYIPCAISRSNFLFAAQHLLLELETQGIDGIASRCLGMLRWTPACKSGIAMCGLERIPHSPTRRNESHKLRALINRSK